MPHLVYDGRTFDLSSDELVLGRHPECQIYIRDGRASRRNSRVFRADDGVWTIEDLDSANGTRVNGEEIFSPHKLVHGDVISIGKARIWFTADSTSEVDATELTPEAGVPILPTEKADPLEGTTCGGCRILKKLGTGFSGPLYRAEMLSTGRSVALRLYHADFAQRDPGFPQRMLEAIRAAARFSHVDVVPILDCGVADNRPWYAMELVDGESLGERIDRDGRCDARFAVQTVLAVAGALAAGHDQGLCHLTLSPASVLVDRAGRIRLVDLGLGAALAGATDRRRTCANPFHAAPEQRSGEVGDRRSDIYSMGALLYHLLTGEAPGAEADAASVPGSDRALERKSTSGDVPVPTVCDKIPELPKRVDEILAGTLARIPAWRYGSMEEVVADLTRLQEQIAQPVRAAGRGVPPPRPATSPRGATAGADIRPTGAPIVPPVIRRTDRSASNTTQWLLWGGIALAICYAAYHFGSQNQSLAESVRDRHLAQADQQGRRNGNDHDVTSSTTEAPPGPAHDADALATRWRSIEEQIDRYASAYAWPRVDKAFQDFIATLPPNASSDLVNRVREQRQKFAAKGEQWYQERRSSLPDQAGPRWAELTRLRDQVPPGRREEIAVLLRETGIRLDQEVAALRAKAGRLVEEGKFDSLTALAGAFRSIPPGAVLGSRVQALRSQLAEVQILKDHWNGTWAATRQLLGDAQGELALGKAAALALTNAEAEALQALAVIKDEDPLAARRDRLRGMNVTELAFAGPEDLNALEMLQGSPRMADKALTAPPGTACGIACTAPLAGSTWRVETAIDARASGDLPPQVALALQGEDGKPLVQLRIAPDARHLRIQTAAGTEQFQPGAPPAGPMLLRFDCRDGVLTVKDREEQLAQVQGVTLPTGTRLQIDITGMDWRMTLIRIVAAP